jgi:hypothetical protein
MNDPATLDQLSLALFEKLTELMATDLGLEDNRSSLGFSFYEAWQ